ncbi:MAG: YceI family protein [Ardenticatenaceae bacterium]|nr:YceI family protein [Ardenticatenaceae bacterium]
MHTKRYFLVLLLTLLLAACGGEQPAVEEAVVGDVEAGETAVPAEAPAPGVPNSDSAGSPVTYTIIQDESEVRFTLSEELRGNPTTVVGRSNQIRGTIGLDLSQPAAAQISPIVIDAASLATDENMRNRAIGRFILVTSSYPEITFTPTGITGLPDSVTIGEPVSLSISGDLAITNVTLPVVFETTVTAVSDTRLEGHASTTIQRANYNLTIPSVPAVANVAEDILLEIDFVAEAN